MEFWRAAEVYRFITSPFVGKMQCLVAVCQRFFNITLDSARAKSGGAFAECVPLSAINVGHRQALQLAALLDVYEPGIGNAIAQRINRWKREKRGALPPSDLFLPAQHLVERALGDTAVAEFVDEFW